MSEIDILQRDITVCHTSRNVLHQQTSTGAKISSQPFTFSESVSFSHLYLLRLGKIRFFRVSRICESLGTDIYFLIPTTLPKHRSPLLIPIVLYKTIMHAEHTKDAKQMTAFLTFWNLLLPSGSEAGCESRGPLQVKRLK